MQKIFYNNLLKNKTKNTLVQMAHNELSNFFLYEKFKWV